MAKLLSAQALEFPWTTARDRRGHSAQGLELDLDLDLDQEAVVQSLSAATTKFLTAPRRNDYRWVREIG